jgi:hypothetical protein
LPGVGGRVFDANYTCERLLAKWLVKLFICVTICGL